MKTELRAAADLTVGSADSSAYTPRDSGSKVTLVATCDANTSSTLAVTLEAYQGGAWRALPNLVSDSTGATDYSLGPQDTGTTRGLLYFDIDTRAGEQYRLALTAAGATVSNLAVYAYEQPMRG